MRSTFLMAIALFFVVCGFCLKDFASTAGKNRHAWRCKAKLNTEAPPSGRSKSHAELPAQIPSTAAICICGKKCKGSRGLKAHQRSCRSIRTFESDLRQEMEAFAVNEDNGDVIDDLQKEFSCNDSAELKRGVRLPRKPEEWDTANKYFHASLPQENSSLKEATQRFNETVYDYFARTYGTVGEISRVTQAKLDQYSSYSKNKLKKILKNLKANQSDQEEIKTVAKLLRSKLVDNAIITTDHDKEIQANFWGYCKMFIDKATRVTPKFSKEACFRYFSKSFSALPTKNPITIPSWIPTLSKPAVPFNCRPPSYKEVCKVVTRMKTSASPCPLDQISVICLKRCPYLRTYLTWLCSRVWAENNLPPQWRKAVTILIFKHGQDDEPSNFRPITLEPVCLKIFTSILRNRIYTFLIANGYAESNIQKGFVPGLSGTFEHIAEMGHIINQARINNRSVTITLIDLKNAFGEVRHDIIKTVLDFHHIPEDICALVTALYADFATAIATDTYITNFVPIKKGVLQGDCLSPLLFNMLMNTFIQYVSAKSFETYGYQFSKLFAHRHWLQFADDAAAISSLEAGNQVLLNAFSRWCAWSRMSIRVDKCSTFGMRKIGSCMKQVKPSLFINNERIRPVEIDESFTYLGKHFNFRMTSDKHKTKLLEQTASLLTTITDLPLHPRFKILLYRKYALAKISWDLTVSDVTITWVKQALDTQVCSCLRYWLDIPVSGTLNIATLTQRKYGLSIVLPSARFLQCQVTYRSRLNKSNNKDIVAIHQLTSFGRNVQVDQYKSTKEAIKDTRRKTEDRIVTKLACQSIVVKAIWRSALSSTNKNWQRALESMPRSIYNFGIRYLNNSLPNRSNLHRWGSAQSPICTICPNCQTLGHVVGGCTTALVEGRYNWRHNSILLNFARAMKSLANVSIYCDLDGYEFNSPSTISGDKLRPDFIAMKDNQMYIMELTVGFETNTAKNAQRKLEKYKDLVAPLPNKAKFLNFSMSALGTVDMSADNYLEWTSDLGMSRSVAEVLMQKLMKVAMRTTYYIFCRRDQPWSSPAIMTW